MKDEPGFFRKFAFCNFHFSMKFSVPFQNAKLIPASYEPDFALQNDALRQENAFFWNIYL